MFWILFQPSVWSTERGWKEPPAIEWARRDKGGGGRFCRCISYSLTAPEPAGALWVRCSHHRGSKWHRVWRVRFVTDWKQYDVTGLLSLSALWFGVFPYVYIKWSCFSHPNRLIFAHRSGIGVGISGAGGRFSKSPQEREQMLAQRKTELLSQARRRFVAKPKVMVNGMENSQTDCDSIADSWVMQILCIIVWICMELSSHNIPCLEMTFWQNCTNVVADDYIVWIGSEQVLNGVHKTGPPCILDEWRISFESFPWLNIVLK